VRTDGEEHDLLLAAREIEDDAVAVTHADGVLAREVALEEMKFESWVIGAMFQELQNALVALDEVGMPA
jgi:hypothetical protein